MKRITLIICLLLPLIVTIDAAGLKPRIINGWDAPEGKYPYFATIIAKSRSLETRCGGSIIHKRWILTAAHCFTQFNDKRVEVRVGTILRKGPSATTYGVVKVIPHEHFDLVTSKNDIALVRVDKDIEWNAKTKPIELATQNTKMGDNENVVIVGFGDLKNFKKPDVLQTAVLKMYGYSECKKVHEGIKKTQICTIPRQGRGPCMGDSGGPLVNENGIQVGIDSHSDGIGPETCGKVPEIYTRVSSFIEWIHDKIHRKYEKLE